MGAVGRRSVDCTHRAHRPAGPFHGLAKRVRLVDKRRNLLEQSVGTVLIDRPGRFRFDYTDLSQLIVGVGARVWSYDPELAQVTVRDVDTTLGSTPAVLLANERPVAQGYRVETLDVGGSVDVFILEPEAEHASIIRIRLAFSSGELRHMELI